MDTALLASRFAGDYYADRAAFMQTLSRFTVATGRRHELQTQPVDGPRELCVTAAELLAPDARDLVVLCTGIHGIEGYAGSAIVRHALDTLLRRLEPRVSLLLVHALNPFGFAQFQRVNANNIDLNRNCQIPGESLFDTDSSAYAALRSVLSPRAPARVGGAQSARFYAKLLTARARHGDQSVRQASLAGQYIDAEGVFFGGDRLQPELSFFQRLFERLAARHPRVLVIDLHTGYGIRGEAYALFGRSDTPAIHASTVEGVSDDTGHNRTYTVHGDLIGYCHFAAKRAHADGVFDGVALELGTHGMSIPQQLADLHTVVLENQLRHHGAMGVQVEPLVRDAFRELFYPGAREWRVRALQVGMRGIELLLRARGYVKGA
jgi:predicted deacylase